MEKERLNSILLNMKSEDEISKAEIDELVEIVPEFKVCMECKQNNPYHICTVGEHILKSITYVTSDILLRITMFLHDIGKPACKTTDENGIDHFYLHPRESYHIGRIVLRRLGYDEEFIENVVMLVTYHDARISSRRSVRRLVNKIREENLLRLINIWIADAKAQNPVYLENRISEVRNLEELFKEMYIS